MMRGIMEPYVVPTIVQVVKQIVTVPQMTFP
jgi:hypothetical protein